ISFGPSCSPTRYSANERRSSRNCAKQNENPRCTTLRHNQYSFPNEYRTSTSSAALLGLLGHQKRVQQLVWTDGEPAYRLLPIPVRSTSARRYRLWHLGIGVAAHRIHGGGGCQL